MKNKTVSIYADYEHWFLKDFWTLEEWGVLIIGLNPDVVLDPELPEQYQKYAPDGDILYQLYKFECEFWDWQEAIFDSTRRFYDFCYASELDHILENADYDKEGHSQYLLKPMEIVQWSVDEGRGFHYRLTEYLQKQGYDFRFSEDSKIMEEFKIYSKMDIWPMLAAARLLLGLSPEATNKWLSHSRNYYRHMDPNYNYTKRDEVLYVLETALQSWKTGNLEFHETYGDDFEDTFFNEEEGSVQIEARTFIDWAIKKGFSPPEQLLELMGYENFTSAPKAFSGIYQTPYMTLMTEAINALNITPNNQPPKQTIIEWLEKTNPNLSGRERDYLATFIRMPEMKKGGYYKGN